MKALSSVLDLAIGQLDSDKQVVENTELVKGVEVRKSVDNEERRALFIVLEPQDEDGFTADLHEDWYSEEDVLNACRSFNVHCRKANLLHKIDVTDDLIVIEQSYCTPVAFNLERPDGTIEHVKKGTWLMEQHYPEPYELEDDLVWPKIKDGTYTGLSINCEALGYEING